MSRSSASIWSLAALLYEVFALFVVSRVSRIMCRREHYLRAVGIWLHRLDLHPARACL